MKARSIAQGGLLAGLSIAVMYIASFLQICGWAITMLVGFIPAVFFLRGEPKTGVVQFLATALIGLFILPDKSVAILYAFFFGLYTVLKLSIEGRFQRKICIVLKTCFIELWVMVVLYLIRLGFFPELPPLTRPMFLAAFGIGLLVIIYYDFCLTRIFSKLRQILRRIPK